MPQKRKKHRAKKDHLSYPEQDGKWSAESRRKRRKLGQNFLRSERTAEMLVGFARVCGEDTVVEIGAGSGMLTRSLVRRAGRVVAIERDERWARSLRREFSGDGRVEIVRGDGLAVKLPEVPFRVVANIPFGLSTAILARMLDDPETPLEDIHIIVQDAFAKKHTRKYRTTLRTLYWNPWWEFAAGPLLPARVFDPVPKTDARILVARRRDTPLVAPEMRELFRAFVREVFAGRGNTLGRVLKKFFTGGQIPHLARDNGFSTGDFPSRLCVEQWASLFHFMLTATPKSRWPKPGRGKRGYDKSRRASSSGSGW